MPTAAQAVLDKVPEPVRPILVKNRVLVKFGLTGGLCFVVTMAINYALKFTVLEHKPVTAFLIATAFATVLSYLMQRRWAFRVKTERRRGEFSVFVLVNAVSMGINAVPLWISRYVLGLEHPAVGHLVQELADFVSSMLLGTLLAMLFRWWAYRRFVFSG
ncbi:GtrA family protein [Actinomadura kijaniata]|uniref:Putative flippase GtrA n=1 Tax=Actinomadura namibiensis TaxID=182080 RepID=A0A7W3LJZ2_ACTNM|nr:MULTISPECIES: GtrA family protein [Actinomadura]MBA8949478.1 putative flippase GtrA [Actinomadura namibiensis]